MWLYHEENVKNEPASNNKGAYEDLTLLVDSLLTTHVPVCLGLTIIILEILS